MLPLVLLAFVWLRKKDADVERLLRSDEWTVVLAAEALDDGMTPGGAPAARRDAPRLRRRHELSTPTSVSAGATRIRSPGDPRGRPNGRRVTARPRRDRRLHKAAGSRAARHDVCTQAAGACRPACGASGQSAVSPAAIEGHDQREVSAGRGK